MEKIAVPGASPVAKADRIHLLDCLRGVALLGILIMNINGQGLAGQLYEDMDLRQPLTGLNFYAWTFDMVLFEGTMRGLFSMLFGAGALLLIDRLQKNHTGLLPADVYYKRLVWLMIFGLINAYVFLWPGDILFPYAIVGLFLFPFRNLSARQLLIAAVLVLAIATFRDTRALYRRKETIREGRVAEVLAEKKKTLTEEQQTFLGKWKTMKKNHSKDSIPARLAEEEKKIVRKSYGEIWKYYADLNENNESIGIYRFFVWDILLFFFIGMAFYKNGFILGTASAKTYIITAITGTAIGLWLSYTEQSHRHRLQFDHIKYWEQAKLGLYEIRRVFQSVGYLGLLILFYRWKPGKKLLTIFAPVGRMAFTNYLLQSVITSIIFYGMDWFAALQRYQLYYIVAGIWVFQIVSSHIWLRYFNMGPLEWLWRSLTYWKRPALMKKE
jgi:uncharacterized protein